MTQTNMSVLYFFSRFFDGKTEHNLFKLYFLFVVCSSFCCERRNQFSYKSEPFLNLLLRDALRFSDLIHISFDRDVIQMLHSCKPAHKSKVH